MNNELELLLLEALYSIKAEPGYRTCGICDNVECLLDELDEDDERKVNRILRDLFVSWPKFSGDIIYPIKAPGYQTGEASYLSEENHNKWEGEYGNLRKELLDFLINSLKNEV